MKTFLYVILGVVLIIVLIVTVVFYLTWDAVKVVDKFFANIKANNYEESYKLTSTQFREATSLSDFTNFVKSSHLNEYQKIDWSSRGVTNWIAELEGAITLMSGESLPLALSLVKNNDGTWQIQFIDLKSWVAESTGMKLPGNEEILSLVRTNISNYISAFNNESPLPYYQTFAEIWKDQMSLDKADEILLKPFKGKIEFSGSYNDFVYQKDPIIDENWILIIDWYFSQPVMFQWDISQLYVVNKFIKENWVWKLVGLNHKVY